MLFSDAATIRRVACLHACLVITGADADAIRTSYKRLAQKWHPEKNPKSEEAVLVSSVAVYVAHCSLFMAAVRQMHVHPPCSIEKPGQISHLINYQ